MKKLLMTTLLMGFCLNSTTARAISTDKLKGFYITAGVGAMALSVPFEIDSLANTSSKKLKRSLFAGNASFNGVIGYEKTFGDNYFAGVEATYIFGKNSINTSNQLTTGGLGATFLVESKVKSGNTWGIAASFGRKFDALSPYIKLGVSSATFESSSLSAAQNIEGIDKQRRYGLITGAGLRYDLGEKIDVIAEFQALLYRPIKSKDFDSDPTEHHILTINPRFYNAWVGIRWKF